MRSNVLLMLCTAAWLVSGVGYNAVAQVGTPGAGNQPSTNVQPPSTSTNPKVAVHVRASKLIGMNIQNTEGKGVGAINDLVIDADTGKIHYAAVTYGGFLGIGNKMFAVPFEAFKFRAARNDANERVLVLDVTQSQLEGSVGFDENNWPNFADESFTRDLDRRYKIQRNGKTGVDVNINSRGVDVDVKRDSTKTDPRP